jgi:hypothetical protein
LVALTIEEFHDQQTAWHLEGNKPRPVLVPRYCGHDEEIPLALATAYPTTIQRLRERRCNTCLGEIAAVHAEADKDAMHRATQMGLPELQGTHKQVSWAVNLRDHAITIHGFESIEPVLLVQTDAAWWINHRQDLRDLRLFEDIRHRDAEDV